MISISQYFEQWVLVLIVKSVWRTQCVNKWKSNKINMYQNIQYLRYFRNSLVSVEYLFLCQGPLCSIIWHNLTKVVRKADVGNDNVYIDAAQEFAAAFNLTWNYNHLEEVNLTFSYSASLGFFISTSELFNPLQLNSQSLYS